MPVCAAVMTGKGTSAIATIGVFGPSAQSVLTHVFLPGRPPLPTLDPGRMCLGHVVDKGSPIDQVILACEAPQVYMIHCHGNPLIVEKIMSLLAAHQVRPVTPEQMRCRIWRSQGQCTLTIEARLALLRARTLTGTRIILQQIDGGLAETLRAWQAHGASLSVAAVQTQVQSMLTRSEVAWRIIYGCRAVLVGPPNTGKSTLFNCLTGRDGAIVADIEGTTRDWIEASCCLESLHLTLIDTAGLDPRLMAQSDVDRMSQQRTLDVIDQADLVLVVLDARDPVQPFQAQVAHRLQGKRVITLLNKSDLRSGGPSVDLPHVPGPVLEISVKQESGLNALRQAIGECLGMTDFDPDMPVCVTERQRRLLAAVQTCATQDRILHLIDTLLHGRLEETESNG